jgi:hypothetical protein
MKISKILALVVVVGMLFAMSAGAFAVPMEGCSENNNGPHLNTESFYTASGDIGVVCHDCHEIIAGSY